MLELLTDLMNDAEGRCAYAEARHVDAPQRGDRRPQRPRRRDRQLGVRGDRRARAGRRRLGLRRHARASRAPAPRRRWPARSPLAEAQPRARGPRPGAGRRRPSGTGPRPTSVDPFAVSLEGKLELLLRRRGARCAPATSVSCARPPPAARWRERKAFASTEGAACTQETVAARRRDRRATRPTADDLQVRSYPDRPRRRPERGGGLGARPRPRPRRQRPARGRGGGRAAHARRRARRARARSCCTASRSRSRSTSRSGTRWSSTASCSARPPTRGRAGSCRGRPRLAALRLGAAARHGRRDAARRPGLVRLGRRGRGRACALTSSRAACCAARCPTARVAAAGRASSASGGCARADGFARQPIVRMTNVSLEPGEPCPRSPTWSPTPTRACTWRPTARGRSTTAACSSSSPPSCAARSAAASWAGCIATAPTPGSRRASGAGSTRSAGPRSGGCGG